MSRYGFVQRKASHVDNDDDGDDEDDNDDDGVGGDGFIRFITASLWLMMFDALDRN